MQLRRHEGWKGYEGQAIQGVDREQRKRVRKEDPAQLLLMFYRRMGLGSAAVEERKEKGCDLILNWVNMLPLSLVCLFVCLLFVGMMMTMQEKCNLRTMRNRGESTLASIQSTKNTVAAQQRRR